MPTTEKHASHFLFVPMTAWGHVRPACQLALRLLEYSEQITITILTAPQLLAKTKSEISAHIPGGAINTSSRIRVFTAFNSWDNDFFKIVGPFIESYYAVYKNLQEEKRITCAATGLTYEAVSAPDVVILDFFFAPLLHVTRALSGKSVPIFNWTTGSPYTILRLYGPEFFGGRPSLFSNVMEQCKHTGEDPDDLGNKSYKQTAGAVVRIPGLPPMFDHEFFPQEWPSEVFKILKSGVEMFEHCDGVLLSASPIVDGGGIGGIKTWLSETQQPVYSVGPLLPRSYWGSVQNNGGAPEVDSFLSHALERYGKHSLVLVSFGTIFWPPKAEYVEELVTAFIEKEVPFILVHHSPLASLSDELLDRIKSSGVGLCSSWVPQQYVLSHPATGWFLTHGGQGGVTEALGSGVPLICWPIEADQPTVSANVSLNLHVAFELLEVRTGPGLQGIYRLDGRKPLGTREAMGREIREVIDASRGEIGREMRKTAQAISAQLKESWSEEGIATKDLSAFVDKVIQIRGPKQD